MRTSFLFDPDQESPESLARRRELAEAILQRSSGSAPSNIGEGLSAIGQALGARIALNRAGKAEAAGRSKALESFNSIFGGGRTVDAVKTGSGSYEVPMPAGGDVIRAGLIKRGLPEHVADAFVLNFKDESNLNPGINEAKPIVPGSRGGFGLSQWTGDRRRNLEAFAGQRGVPVSDLDMQLDFLMTELQGPENDAFKAIMAEGDTGGAAAAIVNKFLRPAEQHRASREARYRRYGGAPAGMIDARPAPVNTGINPADYMDTRPAQPTGADPASFRQPLQLASADPNFNYAPQAPIQPRQRVADAMMSNAQPAQAKPTQMAQGGQGFDPRILEALSNPYLPEGHKRVLGAMLEQQMKQMYPDPAAALDMEYKRAQIGNMTSEQQDRDRRFGLDTQKFDSESADRTADNTRADRELEMKMQQAGMTDDLREYQFYADQEKASGREPIGLRDFMAEMKKAGATSVTVGGEVPDGELRKALDKGEGDLWTEYKKQGAISGSMGQDFQVLDELVKIAPQGILQGRLAEMFPGVSSAGDAFQSIVKRIAPTLRAPGSGATSDIEYQGMLDSLPKLRNQPEANAMIGEIMKAKAALNIERADIITEYQTGDISAAKARRMIADLDKRSILTPEMRAALAGIGAVPDAQQIETPKVGDIVEDYEFLGGDPADMKNWKKVTP